MLGEPGNYMNIDYIVNSYLYYAVMLRSIARNNIYV